MIFRLRLLQIPGQRRQSGIVVNGKQVWVSSIIHNDPVKLGQSHKNMKEFEQGFRSISDIAAITSALGRRYTLLRDLKLGYCT